MTYFFFLLALVTGIMVSTQSGVNAALRQQLQNPVMAALISFGTGFLALVLGQLLTGGPVPTTETLRSIPAWKWTGGLLGAIYVTTVIITVPRIGVASLVSLSVAGQLIGAVILDHYGWLNLPVHPVSPWRLVGLVVLVIGVVLVVKN